MGKVKASVVLPGFRASQAEALWYDTSRWPTSWTASRTSSAPRATGRRRRPILVWQSTPAGRGRVIERVTAYEPRLGQTAEVDDPKMTAIQRVAFKPKDEGVELSLALDYTLKGGGPLRPFTDFLFIRRAISDSLRRTVTRFARELRADAELERA